MYTKASVLLRDAPALEADVSGDVPAMVRQVEQSIGGSSWGGILALALGWRLVKMPAAEELQRHVPGLASSASET